MPDALPAERHFESARGRWSADEVEGWAAGQRERSERGEFFFGCIQTAPVRVVTVEGLTQTAAAVARPLSIP